MRNDAQTIHGVHCKRVNKTVARNFFNKGFRVYFKKEYQKGFFSCNIADDSYDGTNFDTIINSFEYYNHDNELGKTTVFYIPDTI